MEVRTAPTTKSYISKDNARLAMRRVLEAAHSDRAIQDKVTWLVIPNSQNEKRWSLVVLLNSESAKYYAPTDFAQNGIMVFF